MPQPISSRSENVGFPASTQPTTNGIFNESVDLQIKYSTEERRDIILRGAQFLFAQVQKGVINDLGALALLTEFAALMYPTNYPLMYGSELHAQFVDDIGATLTGVGGPMAPIQELRGQYHPNYKAFEGFGQSGFAYEFQDARTNGIPDLSSDQPHHFWFYVQVAFYDTGNVATIGNFVHEAFPGSPQGSSYQDFALGQVGAELGEALFFGQLSVHETGDWIMNNLAPGSSTARKWDSITRQITYFVAIEAARDPSQFLPNW
jgi:hypothetical protein